MRSPSLYIINQGNSPEICSSAFRSLVSYKPTLTASKRPR